MGKLPTEANVNSVKYGTKFGKFCLMTTKS